MSKSVSFQENVYKTYKLLKTKKSRQEFLEKCFIYAWEDKEFDSSYDVNIAFQGVLPSIKLRENGGGNNNKIGNNQYTKLLKNQTNTNEDNKINKSCGQSEQLESSQDFSKHAQTEESMDKYDKITSLEDISNNKTEDEIKVEEEKNNECFSTFIDYGFLKSEYEKGDFDFDLEKFWNFWKDKGLTKKELTNKLISWDIKERDKKKLQNINHQLAKSLMVNKDLKYQYERQKNEESNEGKFYF